MQAEVWFDGACSGNPGPMGAGAIVRADGRERVLSRAVGRGTNNEAEYHGLILGLEEARRLGAQDVVVRGDSQLVLRQIEGRYAVRAPNLRPLFEQARALYTSFARRRVEWVRRGDNAAADEAARRALL